MTTSPIIRAIRQGQRDRKKILAFYSALHPQPEPVKIRILKVKPTTKGRK